MLRLTGVWDTYFEKIGTGRYLLTQTVRGNQGSSWHYAHSPNDTFLVDHSEFQYIYHTNSFGLREKKESFTGDSSVFKILALGDSYTEGVGAPADSTWPSFLETYLNRKTNGSVEVYNAGVSGSDPFYNYKMLETSLVDLKPDLVIQAFNSTDMDDFILRGGMERFQPNNHVSFPPLPWWEPLFRFSHIFRSLTFAIGNNHYLVKDSEMGDYFTKSISNFLSLARKYDSLATRHNFQIVFVIIPEPYFLNEKLQPFLSAAYPQDNFDSSLKQRIENTYLSSVATKYNTLRGLKQADILQGVKVIDLFQALSDTINHSAKYSWPIDGHYNGLGYNIIGHCIVDSVSGLQFLKSNTNRTVSETITP